MAKVKRRTPETTKSRRTPSKPSGGGGFNVPWVPLAVIAGVALAGGLVLYLIWQGTQEAGDSRAADAAREADPCPECPGEFVDLQTILGGTYGASEGVNTAAHVSRNVDYSEQGLPPAGGPHWAGGCGSEPDDAPPFCGPAPWGIYRSGWDAETVVHNMEHGGVVLWYNLTDTALRDDIEGVVEDLLDDDHLIVMMPFEELEPGEIAITSWGHRDKFTAEEYTEERVRTFVDEMDRWFNPENF